MLSSIKRFLSSERETLTVMPYFTKCRHFSFSLSFLKIFMRFSSFIDMNPAKRNVLDLKNETCKNREKRNVLKISHTRHFKATKKQSKTGCFYSF